MLTTNQLRLIRHIVAATLLGVMTTGCSVNSSRPAWNSIRGLTSSATRTVEFRVGQVRAIPQRHAREHASSSLHASQLGHHQASRNL